MIFLPFVTPMLLKKLLLKINSEYTIVTPHKVDPRKATVFFNKLLEGKAPYVDYSINENGLTVIDSEDFSSFYGFFYRECGVEYHGSRKYWNDFHLGLRQELLNATILMRLKE